MRTHRHFFIGLFVIMPFGLLASCTKQDAGNTTSLVRAQVNFTTAPAATPGVQALTLSGNANTALVLTRAEVVVRELRFQRVDYSSDCNGSIGGSDDGCSDVRREALIVSLPLDGNSPTQITAQVPSGTYKRIELRIHKPDDDGDADDKAILAARPEFKKVSIRVAGTFNGAAFTYTTDLQVKKRVELVEPLALAGEQGTAVTLNVDVASWFKDKSGALIDPRTALKGGANDRLVEQNIEASIVGNSSRSGGGGSDDSGSDDKGGSRGGGGKDDAPGDDRGGRGRGSDD